MDFFDFKRKRNKKSYNNIQYIWNNFLKKKKIFRKKLFQCKDTMKENIAEQNVTWQWHWAGRTVKGRVDPGRGRGCYVIDRVIQWERW